MNSFAGICNIMNMKHFLFSALVPDPSIRARVDRNHSTSVVADDADEIRVCGLTNKDGKIETTV